MMTRGLGVPALLIGAHLVLHSTLGLAHLTPELLSAGLVLLAREVRLGTAAGVGFALGLSQDALYGTAFGAATLGLTLVAIVGYSSRTVFGGRSGVLTLLLAMGATSAQSLLYGALGGIQMGPALAPLYAGLLAALLVAVSDIRNGPPEPFA